MTATRQDIWALGSQWTPTTLWYAKAVRELSSRAIADRTSWRFLAAIHGIDEDLWRAFGYLAPGEALPPKAEQKKFWNQCQHQTWFFLPWHRGYVVGFEKIVRAAIAAMGGPADWALPYWNYNNASIAASKKLPWCFLQKKLPDGSDNPLFERRRYGDGSGKVVLSVKNDIDLTPAFSERDFAGQSGGGSPGFGGPQTRFHHGAEQDGVPSGLLEDKPHNHVHSRTGGIVRGATQVIATNLGLMSMPDTAALDPVFWVHHANIDRLWEIWLAKAQSRSNPTTRTWLNGSARRFVVPDATGGELVFVPRDMLNLRSPALDYRYEDLSDPTTRATALAATTQVKSKLKSELIGATSKPIRISGGPAKASVHFDAAVASKVVRSFAAAAAPADADRDRVFLNLENIRGLNDAAVIGVYVSPAKKSAQAEFGERFVGSFALFGVGKASAKDGPHAGNGLTTVLEITDAVRAPGGSALLNASQLNVQLVPQTDVAAEDKISVGRVSIYRTGR
jgi:tyrosinase